MAPTEHELKSWPQYFDATAAGRKTFEVRRNDRDYKLGDTLWLREWEHDSTAYTGREMRATVTYIMRPEPDSPVPIPDGYCVMAIKRWLGRETI